MKENYYSILKKEIILDKIKFKNAYKSILDSSFSKLLLYFILFIFLILPFHLLLKALIEFYKIFIKYLFLIIKYLLFNKYNIKSQKLFDIISFLNFILLDFIFKSIPSKVINFIRKFNKENLIIKLINLIKRIDFFLLSIIHFFEINYPKYKNKYNRSYSKFKSKIPVIKRNIKRYFFKLRGWYIIYKYLSFILYNIFVYTKFKVLYNIYIIKLNYISFNNNYNKRKNIHYRRKDYVFFQYFLKLSNIFLRKIRIFCFNFSYIICTRKIYIMYFQLNISYHNFVLNYFVLNYFLKYKLFYFYLRKKRIIKNYRFFIISLWDWVKSRTK